MTKTLCPSCGAEVVFQSSISVFAVCPYCHSMLVRHDLHIESIGRMAQLQEDPSPLQLGTQGRYQAIAFSLIGRLRVGWQGGAWNEWFMLYDDGRHGWLAEAQGFYAILFQQSLASPLPPAQALKLGMTTDLDGRTYEVSDIKQTTCTFGEGELPFKPALNRSMLSIDLTGPQETIATLEYPEEGARLYTGSYMDFDAFHFQSLKEFDGWR